MKLRAIHRIDRAPTKGKIVTHMPNETFECGDEEANTYISMKAAIRVIEEAPAKQAKAEKPAKAAKPAKAPEPAKTEAEAETETETETETESSDGDKDEDEGI